MLEVDLHVHSLFSECGIHTHIELLQHGKMLGLKAIAITDHGKTLKSRIPSPFFDRLKDPVDGIRLLKGMECNVVNDTGVVDLPKDSNSYGADLHCSYFRDYHLSGAKTHQYQTSSPPDHCRIYRIDPRSDIAEIPAG